MRFKRAGSKGQAEHDCAYTAKGKGCTFAEGQEFNHHMAFSKEQCDEAIVCAQGVLDELNSEVCHEL